MQKINEIFWMIEAVIFVLVNDYYFWLEVFTLKLYLLFALKLESVVIFMICNGHVMLYLSFHKKNRALFRSQNCDNIIIPKKITLSMNIALYGP